MTLYQITWSHDDGMDRHEMHVEMTQEQALEIVALLEKGDALDPCVVEPTAQTFEDAVREITSDLLQSDEDFAVDHGISYRDSM